MKPGCFIPALALIAAFCVALASIASAQRMALVHDHSPEVQAYLAAGGQLSDLCTTDIVDHGDHDCPFCRLSDPPADLTPTPAVWLLIPDAIDDRKHDLTRGDLGRVTPGLARGPPCQG